MQTQESLKNIYQFGGGEGGAPSIPFTYACIVNTWSGYMVRLPFSDWSCGVRAGRSGSIVMTAAAGAEEQRSRGAWFMGLRWNFSKEALECRAHGAASKQNPVSQLWDQQQSRSQWRLGCWYWYTNKRETPKRRKDVRKHAATAITLREDVRLLRARKIQENGC